MTRPTSRQKSQQPPPQPGAVGRVIFTLLVPAIRVARRYQIPLGDIVNWAELAYYKEVRRHERTLEDTATQLSVSIRSAARLSRQLKDNFFDRGSLGTPLERIDFLLWTTPASRARIEQVLPDISSEEVGRCIQKLLASGKIVEHRGRTLLYRAASPVANVEPDSEAARTAAISSLSANLADAIIGRYFATEEKAFIRTAGIRVRAERIARVREIYEKHVLPALSDLNEDSEGDPYAIPMRHTVFWAPVSPGEAE